ncbi:hypothetical protein AVEN_245863-1 [Araneus ventricosus]|uniref:Uncharacterized protein n=1 Tax=Araneus ventricosus TaxID=182803 RepID=A0A4Y2MBM9_ARAVE|nr:hypothetical protein AVEN_245863-1 [Araneus ventricosus]
MNSKVGRLAFFLHGLPGIEGYHTSGYQAIFRVRLKLLFRLHRVRIFKMPGFTPAIAAKENLGCNWKRKLRSFPVMDNSWITLFASIVDEKVDEPPYPGHSSN